MSDPDVTIVRPAGGTPPAEPSASRAPLVSPPLPPAARGAAASQPVEETISRTQTVATRARHFAVEWRESTGEQLGVVRQWWDRFIRPVLEPITALGWVVIGVTVAALVAGFWLQWGEALTIGAIGVFLLAGAVGFILGRARYRIELDLNFTRVVVGQRALGRIEIHSNSAKPLLPSVIEVPVGQSTAVFHLPRMNPRDVHEDIFAIPTTRRTVLTVGPVRSVRGDPLGLLKRKVKWTDEVELFVHPRTLQLQESAPGLIRDLEGITTRDLTNADVSFHALRDYVAGDDRRFIHWKSSARTGTLMVRQFEETRRSVLALGISTHPDEYADPEEFETAISVLGSLGLQAIRDEMDFVVQTSRRTLPATTGKRLLDSLSGLDWSPKSPRFLELAAEIGRSHASSSVVMLHAGSAVDGATVRRAQLLLPTGARIVMFHASEGASPSVKSIGGVHYATVGELADLPRIVRALESR